MALKIGARVQVGSHAGIVALDNEDGTWNIEFDTGEEGDIPMKSIVVSEDQSLDQAMSDGLNSWCPAGARIVAMPWAEPKPDGWTRFACFSDTHGLHDQIPEKHKPAVDVLLHAGDFSNTGELEQVESLNSWLKDYPAKHKLVIAGNHDITFHEEYYQAVGAKRFHSGREYDCGKAKGLLTDCTYLEDSSTEVFGYRIFGSPWQPEFCEWAFNLPRGEECRKRWAAIPKELDILITHGPPAGRGDRCSSGLRAGCDQLLDAIKSRKVSVNLFGHIHESYGMSADDVTLFVNASTCTHGYRPTNPPIVFDLPPASELRQATAAAAASRSSMSTSKTVAAQSDWV